jgi:hypothetical protein
MVWWVEYSASRGLESTILKKEEKKRKAEAKTINSIQINRVGMKIKKILSNRHTRHKNFDYQLCQQEEKVRDKGIKR